jgi:hypothetical protein
MNAPKWDPRIKTNCDLQHCSARGLVLECPMLYLLAPVSHLSDTRWAQGSPVAGHHREMPASHYVGVAKQGERRSLLIVFI